MPGKSIFISHSSKDDPAVREIRQALQNVDVEVWADSERLTGGDPLHSHLQQAIESCSHFMVLLTRDSLNSEWVEKEVGIAKSAAKRIIPLLRGVGQIEARRFLGQDTVTIPLNEGPAAASEAMPAILAALGLQLPTETIHRVQSQMAPLADLVLELTHLTMADAESGKPRASAEAKLTYIQADGGREVQSKPYRFTSPIGPIEAGDLAWYLERYINWPDGVFADRAKQVVQDLPKWGRFLYDAVNDEAAREPLEAWSKQTGTAERRFTIKVDRDLLKGATDLQQAEASGAATLLLSLPWELIHDKNGYLFQGKRPVRVRRSLPNYNPSEAIATKPPIRVLLISPRPEDHSAAYIDHRASARPLVAALSGLGDLARFKLLEPPTFPALEKELTRAADANEPYHVVHFDGHGIYDRRSGLGQLCFEDPEDEVKFTERRSKLVGADQLAGIMKEHRIPLVFLEACQSAAASKDPMSSVAGSLLQSGVASVAAMSHSVLVETATRFIGPFYQDLLHGKRVGQAMLAGQRELKSNTFRGKTFTGDLHLEDWFVPVLFQEEQDPQLVRDLPSEQVEDARKEAEKLAFEEFPPEPHEFLGRSRGLLQAERVLLKERYILVRGSGGEGKTRFACELAKWLVATHRFRRATFTSVENLTEARQVLYSIGHQLVANFESRAGTDDELGTQLVEQALKDRRAVLVIDNLESILGPAVNGILDLCHRLSEISETRLIFTSREALPAPFEANALGMGRLDKDTAIRLLSNLLPHAPKKGVTEEDLKNLVDAVGGHARSLVLIAREVGEAGVRQAAANLRPVFEALERKYPGQRENSLLASAELSLRRLPEQMRKQIRPLSVFQGGGGLGAIRLALGLDPDAVRGVAQALIGVGLAEYVDPGYLRFDPALLGGDLTPEEREAAIAAWAGAMVQEIRFLYGQRVADTNLANNLTLLELPNFLAALARAAKSNSPEEVVDLATKLEGLVESLNRPRILARLVEIRTAAAARLGEWSHAGFLASSAAIDRLLDQGQFPEAVWAAQSAYSKCEAAGDSAYVGASYDLAVAQLRLGRALRMSGDAHSALPHLEQARGRFQVLNEDRMADVALTDLAGCLTNLGRYDAAGAAYQEAIGRAELRNDPRSVATSKGQLATVRLFQKNYAEALRLYHEAIKVFEQLNEPGGVATSFHQMGRVHQELGQFEEAERAYQRSLQIEVQRGDKSGQASTLSQLGNLYSAMGRREDAVRFYRQSAEISVAYGNLAVEGRIRGNVADELVKLGRHDEARQEIERAIECFRPFGHAVQPWKAFDILYDLERAVGNEPAALAARQRAIELYLSYRRDGGHPEMDANQIAARVAKDSAGARAALNDPTLSYRAAAEITLALERGSA